jgi:hypothetical protein
MVNGESIGDWDWDGNRDGKYEGQGDEMTRMRWNHGNKHGNEMGETEQRCIWEQDRRCFLSK